MRFVGPDFREATGLATVKIASRHVPPRTKGVHLDVRALALWTNAAVLHANTEPRRNKKVVVKHRAHA